MTISTNVVQSKQRSPQMMKYPSCYYFFDYLCLSDQSYWLSAYKTAEKLHDIFDYLKKRNKISFRQAFILFRKEHPDLNIYSERDVSGVSDECLSLPNADSEVQNDFTFLQKCLKEHGFTPCSKNVWKSSDGMKYEILIQRKD